MKRKCAYLGCKKIFEKKHNCQKYCSIDCQEKATAENKRKYREEHKEAPAIFWFAKISNFEEPDEFRKIKIDSYKKDFALRQAKDFCGMEEYVVFLYDKENKVVWEISPDEKENLRKTFLIKSS